MFLRFLSLVLAFSLPAIAQDNTDAKSKSGKLQVRLLAETAPDALGEVFLLQKDTKSASFPLPTRNLSDPVEVATRVMVLKTLDKEIPLCTITLPETGNSFAVILVTAKPTGYQPIVVRTDDPAFKAGDVVFINRSEKTVLGKLGTTTLSIKPGEISKSRPTGAVDNTYYDIAFATRDEKGDKILSSSRWPIDNALRSYLFFFTNAKGRTAFRAVDEFLPPAGAGKP
jgi:hypothetical protein